MSAPAITCGLSDLLADVPGIGLDDIGAADLARRVDHKYLLSLERFSAIAGGLRDSHRLLTVGGLRRFSYRSDYLDTPDLVCFRSHRQNRRLRWKARTRLYTDSGLCRFEIKLKTGRGDTDKHAITIGGDQSGGLPTEGRRLLDEVLARQYRVEAPTALTPSLTVDHARITLIAADGTGRVTLDTDLSFTSTCGVLARLLDGFVLVETKSRDGRGSADRLLRAAGVRPVSVSKYCAGIALTHPDQPTQPWRPLLRRYFTP